MATASVACPGCGLDLPRNPYPYHGYYLASEECWAVYNEVLAREYQNAVLFGRVHQLTVDAYAVQHAGGPHPDKSVCIHLVGLYLVLERGVQPPDVPRRLQRLAARVSAWPHFTPPGERGRLTVLEVAQSAAPDEHARQTRVWAESVWRAWAAHHGAIATLAETQVPG